VPPPGTISQQTVVKIWSKQEEEELGIRKSINELERWELHIYLFQLDAVLPTYHKHEQIQYKRPVFVLYFTKYIGQNAYFSCTDFNHELNYKMTSKHDIYMCCMLYSS
jgi:hypothetical protein